MSSISFQLVTTFTLIFSMLHCASSLQCYTCSEESQKACSDPFDNSTIKSTRCPFITQVCVKQVVTKTGGLMRLCAPKDYCTMFKSPVCETCSEDYCNSGYQQVPSFIAVVLLLPYYFYTYFF